MADKKVFAVKADRNVYIAAHVDAVRKDETIQAWVLDAIHAKLKALRIDTTQTA